MFRFLLITFFLFTTTTLISAQDENWPDGISDVDLCLTKGLLTFNSDYLGMSYYDIWEKWRPKEIERLGITAAKNEVPWHAQDEQCTRAVKQYEAINPRSDSQERLLQALKTASTEALGNFTAWGEWKVKQQNLASLYEWPLSAFCLDKTSTKRRYYTPEFLQTWKDNQKNRGTMRKAVEERIPMFSQKADDCSETLDLLARKPAFGQDCYDFVSGLMAKYMAARMDWEKFRDYANSRGPPP